MENVVIIDSNFILLPIQFKIDYIREIRDKVEGSVKFVIYQQVLDELNFKKKKFENSTRFARELEAGVRYLKEINRVYDIKIINEVKNKEESTDDFLIRKCLELKEKNKKIFLATNDIELRKKARDSGVNLIFLRQKKYLDINYC
ncbi:MAG: type II toxin-antitoxin system VapC family toxin, partial [Promethearchaeota archaeon]